MTIQTEKLKLLDKEKILKIHIKQEGIYAYIRTLFVCLSITPSFRVSIYSFL